MSGGLSEKVDWEITVTTIYCDAVDEEVTLVVNADGTWRCTGQQKYEKPDKQAVNSLRMRLKKSSRILSCKGTGCRTVGDYVDSLLGKDK